MNPFLYDVFRVLQNKGVLLIIVLTTCLAFTGLLIFSTFNPATNATEVHDDEQIVVLLMGIIFSFFVPLLGIQSGYSTYARDRASGVLETVLVRPVTRTRVIISRYLAVVLASAVGIGLAVGLVDGMNQAELGVFLPAQDTLGLFAALLVETVAYAGILFLIAHLVRTPGAVMGASVVSFVLIDVIWFFLLVFVALLLGGVNTTAGLKGVVQLEYCDPSGFTFLMLAYAQGGLFGDFYHAPLGTLGVTPIGLLVAGLFWSTVPFLFALYLARTRD